MKAGFENLIYDTIALNIYISVKLIFFCVRLIEFGYTFKSYHIKSTASTFYVHRLFLYLTLDKGLKYDLRD